MALQSKTITGNGSRGHHRFTLTITENSKMIVQIHPVLAIHLKFRLFNLDGVGIRKEQILVTLSR